jgi:gliding motility-associated-like protein
MYLKIRNIILIAALFLGVVGQSDAKHIYGGEITYVHLEAKKYKVFVKVYRDCSECKFDGNGGGTNTEYCPDIPELKLLNSINGKSLATFALNRQSVNDITPVCSTQVSLCGNNSNFPNGIEEHLMYTIVDLGDYNNICKFDFALSMSSRNECVNPSSLAEKFYNYASVDLCGVPNNNSAVLNSDPLHFIYLNKATRYSVAATDADGDSMSYHLVDAKISYDKSIAYGTNKSSKKPLTVNCLDQPCTVNKNLRAPTGLYFNDTTGELVLTATKQDECGVFVIEVREWRKVGGQYVQVGLVRRDVQFNVQVIGTNNAPYFTNSVLDYSTCANEEICIDFAVNDLESDSVKIFWNEGISDGQFIVKNHKRAPYHSAAFCWKPKTNDVRKEAYNFTIKLVDNGCPLNNVVYRTVSIKVYDEVVADFEASLGDCGLIKAKALSSTNQYRTVYWEILSESKKVIDYQFETSFDWQAPSNGLYYLRMVYGDNRSSCSDTKLESILVDNISNMAVNVGNDFTVCKGQEVTLIPKVYNSVGKVDYDWNVGKSSNPSNGAISLVVDKLETFALVVEDDNGCIATDTAIIDVHPESNFKTSDTFICKNSDALNLNGLVQNASAKGIQMNPINFNKVNLSQNGDDWYFNHNTVPVPGEYEIEVVYTDENLCVNTDNIIVHISEMPEFNFNELRKFCSNEVEIYLNREANVNIDGGVWVFDGHEDLISGDVLTTTGLMSGVKYELRYEYLKDGCGTVKSFNLEIIGLPDVKIIIPSDPNVCDDGEDLTFVANIAGGSWFGDGMQGNKFNSSRLEGDHYSKISYQYTDPVSGCSNKDILEINLHDQPQVSLSTVKDAYCEGERVILKKEAENINSIAYFSTPALLINEDDENIWFETNNLITDKVRIIINGSSKYCNDGVDTIDIVLSDYPEVVIGSDLYSGCEPFDHKLFVENSNYDLDEMELQWKSGLEVLSYGESHNGNNLSHGKYYYSVVADYKGCKDSFNLRQEVVVYSTPVADFFMNPRVIYADFPVVSFANLTECVDSFSSKWDFGASVQPTNQQGEIMVRYPDDSAIYFVRLETESEFGCYDQMEKELIVHSSRELIIPTAFTPNDKGPKVNNTFKVTSLIDGVYEIKILNRWGQIVFASNNINEEWDGTRNGTICSAGVYAYKIIFIDDNGFNQVYKGTINLLR